MKNQLKFSLKSSQCFDQYLEVSSPLLSVASQRQVFAQKHQRFSMKLSLWFIVKKILEAFLLLSLYYKTFLRYMFLE